MTNAYVLHPVAGSQRDSRRDPQARLTEAKGLATALGVAVRGADIAQISQPRAATFLGTGLVDKFSNIFKELDVDLAIIDAQLTPVQQRNLETAWSVKVLDRTGLILEIFGDRARTREGALQVSLAHLDYQRSRLVRSWTHLERQRGGVGFMGGPGERQIESDRRILAEKITRLRQRLEKVAHTRQLHREARSNGEIPVVALVGYTNAGKSTLFNRLTEAQVVARDMLFATLDPTMRAIQTPSGRTVILSDTVGFISDLPTELVAAFRATLEEVRVADLVLHVRDISDPHSDAQQADVLDVLGEIGFDEAARQSVLEAHNKIDLMPEFERQAAHNAAARDQHAVCVSAETGEGVDDLLAEIDRRLSKAAMQIALTLRPEDGAALAWLYERGCVRDRRDVAGRIELTAQLTDKQLGRFEKQFGMKRGWPLSAE